MNTHTKDKMNAQKTQYKKLILMVILSFIAMFILMYSMVDKFVNVIPNINQFYMAGLMTTPMIIIEMALKSMIPHHAAAILMVKETELNDPEIKKLGNDIISSQQKEIDFMKAKLKKMDNK